MEKIGIDSSVFIYVLEENKHYLKKAAQVLQSVERGEKEAVLSSIGLIEILTGPKKQGRYDIASEYRELITHFPHLAIAGINENIVEQTSDLRARYGITTPDAIHLATAIDFGASTFVTNDKALKKVKEIKVVLL